LIGEKGPKLSNNMTWL